jgi:hypothetical protein
MIRLHKLDFIAILLASTIPLAARAQSAAPIQIGTFHKQVHLTSGRDAIYEEVGGKRLLRPSLPSIANGFAPYSVLLAYSHFERQILRP